MTHRSHIQRGNAAALVMKARYCSGIRDRGITRLNQSVLFLDVAEHIYDSPTAEAARNDHVACHQGVLTLRGKGS